MLPVDVPGRRIAAALLLFAAFLMAASVGTPSATGAGSAGGAAIEFSGARSQVPGCTVPKQLGVVFVIDDSGSMLGSDPDKLRGAAVGNGLQELGVGSVASTVRFATTASVVTAPTVLDAASIASVGAAAAAGLKSTGGTSYDAAFTAAKAQLDAMPATVDRKAVVFLSDGEPTGTFTSADAIISAGIPIYPIGFDAASGGVLSELATRSGGVVSAGGTAAQAQGAMARAVAYLRCRVVNEPETFDLPPGGSRDIPVDVPAGAQALNVLASWDKGALTVQLLRPDGSVLDGGSLRAGESYEPRPTSVRVGVATPTPGKWSVRLTAPGGNAETIQVSIDVLGDGATQHPMNRRPQPEAAGCETEVNILGRVAWSRCLRPAPGGYTSERPVRLAGIDFTPAAGKPIKLLTSGKLESDNVTVSVTTSGPLLPGGTVTLYSGRLSLPLGAATHLEFNGTTKSGGKHAAPTWTVGGLPVEAGGGLIIDWTASGATIDLALGLGRDFVTLRGPSDVDGAGRHLSPKERAKTLQRGFGVSVSLTTSNDKGLSVNRLEGSIDSGRVFGRLAVKNVFVRYNARQNLWTAGGAFVPFTGPLARYALPTISGSIGITVNPLGFGSVELAVSNINKPIGPYIYLQKLGGEVRRVPAPFRISGSAGISLGPKVDVPFIGKVAAIEADGSMAYLPPTSIELSGGLKLFGQTFADGSVDANLGEATGNLSGNLNLSWGGNGFDGRLEGWLRRSSFQVSGNAGLRVFGKTVNGAEAFVNERAAGACRRGWGPDFGFTYDFRDSAPDVMASSCSFGSLKYSAAPSGLRARRAQAGAQVVEVRKNSPGELIKLHADGGAPAVVVRGPGTEFTVDAGAGYVEQPAYAVVRDEPSNDLWIVLNRPAAGRWTFEPLAGAPPLAPLGATRAKRNAEIRARLSKRGGGRYTVRWKAKLAGGDRVKLVERGSGGLVRTIKTSRRAGGAISFRPTAGPAGVRTITASVERGKAVAADATAGTITLKRDVRPAAPRRLRVVRRGTTVTVRWAGRNAGGDWLATLRTKDGRRYESTTKRRSMVFYGVSRDTAGKLLVRSITGTGVESSAASKSLSARKTSKRRR